MGTSKNGIESGDGGPRRADRRRVEGKASGGRIGADSSPLDLGRSDAHAVAFLEHLIRRDRLAVHADEVVLRVGRADPLVEQPFDGGPFGDLDVVGKAAVKLSTGLATRTRLQNRT